MITEIVSLNIRENENDLFETVFGEAQKSVVTMEGYPGHELQKCIEKENKYLDHKMEYH